MKVVLLVGEPGSGKTSFVRSILPALGDAHLEELKVQTVMANGARSNFARATLYPRSKVLVPGVYDGSLFEGTDRLGRNTTPALTELVTRFARMTAVKEWSVLAEGDRITTQTFVDSVLDSEVDLLLYRLMVDPEECASRKKQREAEFGRDFFEHTASKTVAGKPRRADRLATGLNESWVRGRRAKVANLITYGVSRGARTIWMANHTREDFWELRESVMRSIGLTRARREMFSVEREHHLSMPAGEGVRSIRSEDRR